jgi:hypothetical protein
MHPKWIAGLVFWAVVILAIALPNPKIGDSVWFALVLVAVVWTTLVVVVRAVKNRSEPGPLSPVEKSVFSGRGLPLWVQRFIGDDYDYGLSRPAVRDGAGKDTGRSKKRAGPKH